jgi:tRNA (adenine22-N1)-methyltransferase
MRTKTLSPRLFTIATLIRPNATVIDVGTDHGHLPIHLAYSGHTGKIVASDVASKPLAKAVANIERFGQSNRIETMLCDGIDHNLANAIDASTLVDIIIAGMGGETIAEILHNWRSGNTKHGNNVRFILQPMSRAEKLLLYLDNEGLHASEHIATEGRRTYRVFIACG